MNLLFRVFLLKKVVKTVLFIDEIQELEESFEKFLIAINEENFVELIKSSFVNKIKSVPLYATFCIK